MGLGRRFATNGAPVGDEVGSSLQVFASVSSAVAPVVEPGHHYITLEGCQGLLAGRLRGRKMPVGFC